MEVIYIVGTVLSSALFLYYGVACLRSESMRKEFERFGIPQLRLLIGWSEILGAVGLLVGFFHAPLAVASATGLTVLMSAVVVSRIRLRDSLAESAPALVLAVVNGLLVVGALGRLT